MKRSELEGKNLGELKKIAKSHKVKGYSKFRKSDIPELINLMLNFKISKKPKSRSKRRSKKPKSRSKKPKSRSKKPKRRSRSKKPKRRSRSKKPKRSRSKKPKRSRSKKPKSRSKRRSKKPKRSRSKKPKRSSSKLPEKYSNIVLPGYTKKISKMKIKELKDFAKSRKLKRYSKFKKDDLIVFIIENLNKSVQKDKTPKKYKLPLSKDDVKLLKKNEMIKILKDNGITIGLPNKKSELILLLQQNKCSPVDKKYCDNDELCDIRNNVCMSPDFSKRGLIKIKLDGKEIIGTKQAIDKLKKQIKNSPLKEDNGVMDDIVDIVDNKDEDPLDKFDEDDPIDIIDNDDVDVLDIFDEQVNLNDMDIENSLEEIEIPEKNEKTEMLGDVQKEVLKCLGML